MYIHYFKLLHVSDVFYIRLCLCETSLYPHFPCCCLTQPALVLAPLLASSRARPARQPSPVKSLQSHQYTPSSHARTVPHSLALMRTFHVHSLYIHPFNPIYLDPSSQALTIASKPATQPMRAHSPICDPQLVRSSRRIHTYART